MLVSIEMRIKNIVKRKEGVTVEGAVGEDYDHNDVHEYNNKGLEGAEWQGRQRMIKDKVRSCQSTAR